jgi:hypothetical protein
MSLSDACFDFLAGLAKGEDERAAVCELIAATVWYEPWNYGPEIGLLRETALPCYGDSSDLAARDRLLRTAFAVLRYLDDPNECRPFAAYAQDAHPEVVDTATLATWWKSLESRIAA